MNWENVARAAFEKYRTRLIQPEPGMAVRTMPTWDGLTRFERLAWIDAVQEACDIQARAALA